MAEKNVALELKLEGVDKIIQEVKDLQSEIIRLKDILKGVEEGSDAYDTLSQSIQGLENKLETVKITAQETGVVLETTGVEGATAMNKVSDSATKAGNTIQDAGKKIKEVNFEKAFQSFVRVGSAVTSSFAAAQSVITTFGGDSKAVAEKAAQAQSLLTVAIAAREVAEARAAFVTLSATIATRAKTAADNAQIGVLKRLFALIAAHPYAALAAAIGAVVVAFIALTNQESEAEKQAKLTAKSLDDLNNSIQKIRSESDFTIDRINNLTDAFDKGKISQEGYKDSVESIIPAFKEVYKYLDANRITQFVDNYKDILRLTAEIAEKTKTLNSDELKNDKKAQDRLKSEIKFLEVILVGRKSFNLKVLAEVEALKKAEAAQAEAAKQAAQKAQEDLIASINLYAELTMQVNGVYAAQQKLGELDVQFATQEQLTALKALENSSKEYVSVLQKWNNLQADLTEEDVKRISDAEEKITNAGRKINDINRLVIGGFKKARVELKAADLKTLIKEQYTIESGAIVDLEKQFENFNNRLRFEENFIKQYTSVRLKSSQNTGDALRAEEESYKKSGKALFDILVENERQLASYEGSVEKVKEQLKLLIGTTDELKKSQEVLNGFIRSNAEDITKQYTIKIGDLESNRKAVIDLQTELDTKLFDKSKTFQSQVTALEEQLLAQGFDIRKASYEEKLALLKAFLDKEVKATTDAEGKKETAEEKRLKKIQDNIAAFQSALNSLQQTTTLFFNAQFDQLEKRNKRVQDTIVGDSEEANKKRLEAEKSYQAEKARIEKQAAKTALRISLAQAIANTAEAVTKLSAITGGVGALIAGGAVVAFNLAQVGIIANQLATIDSYKQGGILKRKSMAGGGLVVGPSHEYGGVKFAQGGIELEGNEAVINRNSTVNYMGLLSQINQSGGGKPIGPGYDDSRLIEAIAKQRNTPIRAYVVESDITAKQQVARRLEKLSQI